MFPGGECSQYVPSPCTQLEVVDKEGVYPLYPVYSYTLHMRIRLENAVPPFLLGTLGTGNMPPAKGSPQRAVVGCFEFPQPKDCSTYNPLPWNGCSLGKLPAWSSLPLQPWARGS